MTPVFDVRGFGRFLRGWLALPWNPRRALISLAFFAFYPPFVALTALALGLDRLLFPGYRQQRVTAPVFIVGNFRSGTTFLHRLLDLDRRNFSSMTMWEILFAPSIIQRRLITGIGRLDRRLGAPFGRLRRLLERDWERRNVMHRVALTEPEEDDYLLVHTFSALTTGLSSGLLEQARPYAWFDQRLTAAHRRRILGFYRRCVQRHLHAHAAGDAQSYLAKNPALCPKIASLLDEFPDARIIYLARNPLDVIPSFVSMMRFSWRTVGVGGDDEVEAQRRRFLLDMIGHWYRYPLAELDGRPDARHVVVRYDDLVADPAATVERVYRRLDIALTAPFRRVLERQAAAARGHASRHDYDLGELGLDREQIVTELQDVFRRFDFDPGAARAGLPAAPSRGAAPQDPG